jgi:hypothetical protein
MDDLKVPYKGVEFEIVKQPPGPQAGGCDPGGFYFKIEGEPCSSERFESDWDAIAAAHKWIDRLETLLTH